MSDKRKKTKGYENTKEENKVNYPLTRKIKKKVEQNKEKWLEWIKYATIEESVRTNNTQTLYRTANNISGTFSEKLSVIKDKGNKIFEDKKQTKQRMEVKNRWKEHFE